MSVPVYISATLRTFADKRTNVEAEGSTVGEVIKNLSEEYPDSEKAFFDEDGKLRSFISVYLNNKPVSDLDTAVGESDRIMLVPAIAGGAPVKSVISDERRKEAKLDDSEIERYNKHLMLRDIGVKGQKRIKAARVLVLGLGALGSPVVQYLAAAGVGTIGIADIAQVQLGDIQSQVMHGTRDVKRPRVASARDTIKAINPKLNIEPITDEINAENIVEIVSDYDVIVDCTDNFPSRYLINDACVLAKKPVVFGAVYQFEGQVSVFCAEDGPCYRCRFPEPPPAGLVPSCASGGVISPLGGIVGSIQANEALKLIIGGGECLIGKMLILDTWNDHSAVVDIPRDENCPVCGKNPSITQVEEFDYDDFCGLKTNEDEVPVDTIEPEELAKRIDGGDKMTIVDVREPHERAVLRFPGAVVIPIGQLARRKKELYPTIDTIFICREGKRSILAINTLREAGYTGPMYSLKGGIEAAKNIIFSSEGAWL